MSRRTSGSAWTAVLTIGATPLAGQLPIVSVRLTVDPDAAAEGLEAQLPPPPPPSSAVSERRLRAVQGERHLRVQAAAEGVEGDAARARLGHVQLDVAAEGVDVDRLVRTPTTFSRITTVPLNVWARTGPATSSRLSRDEKLWSLCDPSTPSTVTGELNTDDVEVGPARHLDVEVGFDDVVAAGEPGPGMVALIGVDDHDVRALGVDVELDAVEPLARSPRRTASIDDFGPVRCGDGHAAREVLEPERAARVAARASGVTCSVSSQQRGRRRVSGAASARTAKAARARVPHGAFDGIASGSSVRHRFEPSSAQASRAPRFGRVPG